MARIGEYLYFESFPTKVILRTINSTSSGFALMEFYPNFFSEFTQSSQGNNQCKVSMKSCLKVFKKMKEVEMCKISFDTEASKLVFQLKCRLETVKTHYVPILQYESIQVEYVPSDTPNKYVHPSPSLFLN